jgi:hypothetical protein
MHFFNPIWNFGIKGISQFLVYIALHYLAPILILFFKLLPTPLREILAEGDHKLGHLLLHCC